MHNPEAIRLTIEMAETGRAHGGCQRRRVPAVVLPDGTLVRHRAPVLAACRALIASGVPPETRFEAWWAGSSHPALLGTIGGAAALDVVERDSDSPRFAAWQPHPMANMPRKTSW